ncbi:cyclic nucleotide-binding domain-containing protein [Candidatus Acetothermia bacterium]|jgi:CRP-like cAMP-binding protein|nr:cyclic nucleotide-binding domain-containing protein [Candidatus Acetothermia bacterium]MCI2431816.1 cyclic nucleotide-binding domain-containing protein [Candidatus Acetothermia bacterium]MCI2435742.1 cyclic nucleotide-binding domain-containing protein [Candidatus Acetothermia bacterium]
MDNQNEGVALLQPAPAFRPDVEAVARGDRFFSWIEELSELARYRSHTVIHDEQDAPSAIYWVQRGRIEISVKGVGTVELGPGEFFGELLFEQGMLGRVYCAQALEESVVWVLHRDRVRGLWQHDPEVLAKLRGLVGFKQDLVFLFDA